MNIVSDIYSEVEQEASRQNILIIERLFTRIEDMMKKMQDTLKSCVHQALKSEYVRLKRNYYKSRARYIQEFGYVGCDEDEAVSGLLGNAHRHWIELRKKYRTFVRCNVCEACVLDNGLQDRYKSIRKMRSEEKIVLRASLARQKVFTLENSNERSSASR